MTISLSGSQAAQHITRHLPGAITGTDGGAIMVNSESVFAVAELLKNRLDFDYLNYITAVDYFDYFELVYQFTSRKHNHSLVLKTRCYDRENPVVPSLVGLWRGADFQEREIYDLFGISFQGHPNLKRIVLWAGFEGYPLRKDYL